MAKSTKRPKVDLKPIGKTIDAAISELQKLHDSGTLTTKQMTKLRVIKLPALKLLRKATEKICSDPWPYPESDPWFCPPPDSQGVAFGKVPASKRLGRRKK